MTINSATSQAGRYADDLQSRSVDPSQPSGRPSSETTAEIDLSSFPVVERGHKFEDSHVGDVFDHHGGRTITAGDNAPFSTAMCNFNPMQLNVEFARRHDHPDVVVNPMLVLCTVVGLSVEDLSEAGGPFLGLDDCTFCVPVYPSDTIRAHSTVRDSRRSQSRPQFGVVTWWTEAHNQRDELVLSFQRTNLVATRSAEIA
jgi:itaconyl-CoA hydratase